ncbi:MAG TPA: hypothetical protein PK230_05930 [Chitinophagales bacterium]|nr:hypothetical protein [Chitinophagales bacterium]
MPAFKAFEWLKRLTPEQIDRFELFLQSPYFYRGKLLLSFLEYLRPFLSEEDIDEQVFSNETIFAALQPDQTFKATKVYTWKHELNELVQQFVAEESSINTNKPINDLISILNFAVNNLTFR